MKLKYRHNAQNKEILFADSVARPRIAIRFNSQNHYAALGAPSAQGASNIKIFGTNSTYRIISNQSVTPDFNYEIFDWDNNLIGTVPASQCTKLSLDQANQLEDPADYEMFLQYADDYQVQADDYGQTLVEFFWFTIPEVYLTEDFNHLKYEFTCEGETVEVYVNGKQMEVTHVDGNNYYAQLTEFGAVAILCDA